MIMDMVRPSVHDGGSTSMIMDMVRPSVHDGGSTSMIMDMVRPSVHDGGRKYFNKASAQFHKACKLLR